MDKQQETAIEFTGNRKVDESAIAPKESDKQIKRATSSKPNKQKVAKRSKRAVQARIGENFRARKTRLPILR